MAASASTPVDQQWRGESSLMRLLLTGAYLLAEDAKERKKIYARAALCGAAAEVEA
jgi:hypothetical protein